ncbi:MAG: hypothetical protein K6F96_09445 [Bacteroidales bacterium]|nr:hypothetical protein [Bacteroidales bacterium]
MIDIQTKIHDQFSIEFKVGFSGTEGVKVDHFDVNSWIFIPNSLDINKQTYSNDRFYTDMKSNVRLLTPAFTLKEMVEGEEAPIFHVKRALEDALKESTPEHLDEYEFQLKLFASIFKSSIRNASALIMDHPDDPLTYERCLVYADDVVRVLQEFRNLREKINPRQEDMLTKMGFADEFISHQADIRTMKVLKAIAHSERQNMKEARKTLSELVVNEKAYKNERGYSHAIIGDEDNNRRLLRRHSLLKKYIESALFLKANTTQDGKAVKQISFSLAAGLAMMVYLLVTMPFQKYLGNYPSLIFFILVLFYILKDRIKELTRWLFAYQLKDRYYDNKTVVNIKDRQVGWIKEGMDFITDDKVPEEVLKLRARNKLEADNKLLEEKIILYRKRVEIDNAVLRNQYNYEFKGINDIIRYHINYLTKKMDNPVSVIACLDEQLQVQNLKAERVYALHFVMQFKWEDQVEYKVFHVMVNRNGILSINA